MRLAPFTQSLTEPLLSPLVTAITGVFGGGFNPRNLFAANEPGYLYDLDDLSTVFLDSAGTTPASVNGLVGLVLDKSKGLALGAELSAYANGFSSTTGISTVGTTVEISANSLLIKSTSADGSDRAEIPVSGLSVGKFYKVVINARKGSAGNSQSIAQWTWATISTIDMSVTPGPVFEWIVQATAASGVIRAYSANAAGPIGSEIYVDSISIKEIAGNHRYQGTTGSKPILRGTPTGANLVTNGDFASDAVWSKGAGWTISSGVATKVAGSATSLLQNVTLTAGRIYRFTFTATVTAGGVQPIFSGGTSAFGTLRSASGTYVNYITANSGNTQVGLTTNATFAGTVDNIEIFDVSADSVTAPYALQYDGVDDFLQTASVNFSATDKVTVCHGVRKLSDAAVGLLVELSANVTTNSGSFAVLAPLSTALQNFNFQSNGTALSSVSRNDRPAPTLRVLTCIGNISGDVASLTVSGDASVTAATDQGTGNYGNYALYFGRRAGTSLPYNGLEYSSVCIGRLLTAAELANTERWVGRKTGVSL